MNKHPKIDFPVSTLIVFEQNPESITFYVVPNDHDLLPQFKTLNELYINGDELTAKQAKTFDVFNKWAEKYGQKFVKTTPIKARLTCVIKFGFIL